MEMDQSMFCTLSLGKKSKITKKVPTSQNPVWTDSIFLRWFGTQNSFVELSLFNEKDTFSKNERVGR